MAKKLCKVKDDGINRKPGSAAYAQWVREAAYACKKCDRIWHKENRLCKPVSLKKR